MARWKDGNLTVGAYKALRADIVAGRLKPGVKLVITELCEELGVSLGAVREALSRLTSDGLVISEPQRGFRVSPISQEELEDLTRVRANIEGLCLESAIANGDVKWESGIVSALHELSRTPVPDPTGVYVVNQNWIEGHHRFHAALVAACDSPWLLRIRESLYEQSERYRQLSVPLDEQDRDIDEEHEALAEAAISRDSLRAKYLMEEHLRVTTRILIDANAVNGEGDGARRADRVQPSAQE